MLYAMIEINISCPSCDNPVPLNGPLETAHCEHCQSDIEIPHDYWTDIFKDIEEESRHELAIGEGSTSSIWGTFNSTLLYGRLNPYCYKCKTDFEVKEDLTSSYKHTCVECGDVIEVAPSPEWLRKEYPSIKVFVNAIFQDTPSDEISSDVTIPIAFVCPGCGGALMVDGTERLIKCEYCGLTVYLPDDLWLRIHPAKKKERWFIGFEGEADKTTKDGLPTVEGSDEGSNPDGVENIDGSDDELFFDD